MRPHDADQIIESIGLGGHDWCPDDMRDTYEMDALETIAGMHTEYAVEHQHTPGGQWHQVTGWSHEPPLSDGHTLAPDERIVRRYVTEQEEA